MPVSKRSTMPVSCSNAAPASSRQSTPLLNKDGTRRKSRVLSRKTDHSAIERRRREKINEKLVILQSMVPACRLECQDMIDKKFMSHEGGKERTGEERRPSARKKSEKAKLEMQEKTRTSVILEKLCIISHTVDYLMALEQENKSLREQCRCDPGQILKLPSSPQLDQHYETDHRRDSASMASSSSCDELGISDPFTRGPHPKKRRCHWGSDDFRQASLQKPAPFRIQLASHPVKSSEPAYSDDQESDCEACQEPCRQEEMSSPARIQFHSSCTFPHPRYNCAKHSWCRADPLRNRENTESDALDEHHSVRPPSLCRPNTTGRPQPDPIPSGPFRRDTIAAPSTCRPYHLDQIWSRYGGSRRVFNPSSLYTS